MNKVYVGQTDLIIKITMNRNITGATDVKIHYKKPGPASGSFTATVQNPTIGVIWYSVTTGNIDTAGEWSFWPQVTLANGKIAIGTPILVTVYEPGT